MEEEIWWSCTLDEHEPEYNWPPEDYVKGLELNAKVQRLLIKNAVLAPEAVKDELVVVQIEYEGPKNMKVIAPIVAMKSGQDNQLKVDLSIPCPARLKIVAGQGPIYLTGSHCIESGDEAEEIKEDLRSTLTENLIVGKVIPIGNVYVELPKSQVLQMNTVQTNKNKKGKHFQDNNIGQKTRENIGGGDKMVKTGNKPDLVHSYLEKQLKTSTPIKSEMDKGIFQVPEKRNIKEDMKVKAEKKEIYINLEEIAKVKRKSSHDFSSEKKKKAKTSFNSELNPEEVNVKKTKSEPIPVKRESCKSPVKGKSLAHSKENKAIQEVPIEIENNPKAYQAVGSKEFKGIHEQIPNSEEKAVSEKGKLSEAIEGSSPGNNKGVKTEGKPSQMSKKSASITKATSMIEGSQNPTTSVNKTSCTEDEKNLKTAANDENCKNSGKSGVSPGAKRAVLIFQEVKIKTK